MDGYVELLRGRIFSLLTSIIGENDGRKWGPTMTDSAWHDALVRQGFSGVDLALHDFKDPKDHMLSVLVSAASPAEPDAIPQDVLVVEPDTLGHELQSFCSKMTQKLKASGAKVSVAKLAQSARIELGKKSCILLLECQGEAPLLSEITSEGWEYLKRIILQASNTTWVTRGATVNSESPFANLMTGMARSIRSENPQLALTTLDMDYNAPIDTDKNINSVLAIFASGANADTRPRPDWEYAIRDDKVMVQRILLEKGMNDLIATYNIAPKPEIAPFKTGRKTIETGSWGYWQAGYVAICRQPHGSRAIVGR